MKNWLQLVRNKFLIPVSYVRNEKKFWMFEKSHSNNKYEIQVPLYGQWQQQKYVMIIQHGAVLTI